MKKTGLVLLILLLILLALPIGMGHMAECPSCTSAMAPFALGLCAGVLSLLVLSVLLTSSRFHLAVQPRYRLLLSRTIYKPPRVA